ncbi:MAG TPA: PLP-dependent aminotransferase family protein [Steroidobacteraceae bacterium]|nr:PLP-dependent aminotransferase family protein [Steroidobacteraceae bacterium]
MLALSRTSSTPLVEQIVEQLAARVQDGRLAPGTRMPSIRRLAGLTGASTYTVVDAYDRLVARGLILARAGRGFYVAAQAPPGTQLTAIEPFVDPGFDAVALAQAVLSTSGHLIAAGSGCLPESWVQELDPGLVLGRLCRNRRAQPWAPCPPHGLPELREQLAVKLQQQGISAGAEHILTTLGASQAFDLLCRTLFSPGDSVLVEDPGYFVLFEQLRAHHLQLVPVPRLADGPDLEALEAACRAHRPRAFFLQTLLHNPTGGSMTPVKVHRLLSLAEQYGFAVVEDDVYGDLHEGPAVRLAQVDGFRHVIYTSSFSKTLGPSLRVGFVAADPRLLKSLMQRKLLSVLSAPTLGELFVTEVLGGGRYRRHVDRVRARLARLRRDCRAALESAGLGFEDAGGGMFLWARVPGGIDVDALVRRALERSILLAKGSLFSPAGGSGERLRFNPAHSTDPTLAQFLREALARAA